MARIAVLGLGTMGLPIAQNLRAKGHEVAGFDLNEKACAAFGDGQIPSPQAVAGVDVILSMLPEGKHVTNAYDEVVLAGADAGTLLIDCSTINVETTRALAKKAAEKGFAMVDAPVSGGPEAAGEGALSLMVGGTKDAFARAESILRDLGPKITHFGDAGSGQAAKACHNMICGITSMAVTEGFALADALGLDLDKFFALCSGAAAQSWTLQNRCPIPGVAPDAPSSHNFAPGFAAALMAKDLRLAQAAAASSGQETPFGAEAARKFTEFADNGGGSLDFSAIYQTWRQLPAAE